MSLHTADALILDVRNLGEHDRVVTFLSREDGKKRGVARAARRKHSRFAGQLQPLAKGRLTWFDSGRSDLVRLRSLELVESADFLHRDLEGILLGAYLADHLVEFAQENEASDGFYRLLDSTLAALAAGVDRTLAMRYFEIWVLRLAGVLPVTDACAGCGADLSDGARLPGGAEGLTCERCGTGLRLSAATVAFLRATVRANLPALQSTPPAAPLLAEVGELAARVRREFLQHELKSHRVLHETLDSLPGG